MAETLQSYNPANNDVVGEVTVSSVGDIELSVSRARAAAPRWQELSLKQRAALLKQAAERLNEDAEELGELLSREMGKPLKRGIGEVRFCAKGISSTVETIASALQSETIDDGHTHSSLRYQALGVCAVISPWNYPMAVPQSLILPALMAGNTVVLKPSELTPLIAQRYVEVLNLFLPKDVLQIVHGEDEQGKALVNADVNLIAFTGSRNVGKHILASASNELKRVILELGGKDPLIVLADADIEQAAQCAVANGFENTGQMCVSTERIYVLPEVAEAFESRVTELVAQIKYGIWTDEDISIGPMINNTQRQHVIRQIDEALAQGATALTGPGLSGAGLTSGTEHPEHFVVPTVLANCLPEMDIMREETFGPVLCIQRVATAEEAIKLSNDNAYGLGASVFGSTESAQAVAQRLETGMIGINKSCFGATGTPWVGAKQSGYGYHGSAAGHRQFAQLKVISEAS